jgi:hypothetical protein
LSTDGASCCRSTARCRWPARSRRRSTTRHTGFPVAEIVGGQWLASARKLAADARAAETFLPGGQPPRTGDCFANPRLAATLRMVADGGREAFYNGPIARAIAADMRIRNGLLAERDFADHASEWIRPISTNYRGYDVYELPPNTQGFLVLEMLNILEGFDIAAMGHNSADYLHALVEAKTHRLCRPRRLSRRSRRGPSRPAADAHLETVCRSATAGDRSGTNHRGPRRRSPCRRPRFAATRSISPPPTATVTPSR